MKCHWVSLVAIAAFLPPLTVLAQSDAASSGCPVSFVNFDAGGFNGVSIRVKNVSGKKITGMTFYAAVADATEHWKWLHWGFDDTRPLREFGWNKRVNPGAAKTLSWYRSDLDFEHGGGSAFVLTSVLFEDGSSWEDPPDRASCAVYWYNNHKKGFFRTVELPLRQ